MAKDKEKSINPAQQARKQEKNRALKKAKSEQQARRNERLANRNPDRIQRQIDDLKALEQTGEIKPREKTILADLERDLRAVIKARETLGDKAPVFKSARPANDLSVKNGDRRDGGGVLGKRDHNGQRRTHHPSHARHSDSGDETDESVRAIPMPRDTPPPIPHEFRRSNDNRQRYHKHSNSIDDDRRDEYDDDADADADVATNKMNPHYRSSSNRRRQQRHPQPQTEHKTTYSSAPQLRDLRKEATTRFVPSAVKLQKPNTVDRGSAGPALPEKPEEMEHSVEKEKKNKQSSSGGGAGVTTGNVHDTVTRHTTVPSNNRSGATTELEMQSLAEEEARFRQELGSTRGGLVNLDGVDLHALDTNTLEDMAVALAVSMAWDEIQDSRSRQRRRRHHVEIEDVEDEDS